MHFASKVLSVLTYALPSIYSVVAVAYSLFFIYQPGVATGKMKLLALEHIHVPLFAVPSDQTIPSGYMEVDPIGSICFGLSISMLLMLMTREQEYMPSWLSKAGWLCSGMFLLWMGARFVLARYFNVQMGPGNLCLLSVFIFPVVRFSMSALYVYRRYVVTPA